MSPVLAGLSVYAVGATAVAFGAALGADHWKKEALRNARVSTTLENLLARKKRREQRLPQPRSKDGRFSA